jgi:hypothetical protein
MQIVMDVKKVLHQEEEALVLEPKVQQVLKVPQAHKVPQELRVPQVPQAQQELGV